MRPRELQPNTYSVSEQLLRRWVYLLKSSGPYTAALREVIEELENLLEQVPR